MHEFTIIPKAPYAIKLHLEKFSLPEEPVPGIYENGICRCMLYVDNEPVAYNVEVISEAYKPRLKVTVVSERDKKIISNALGIIKNIYQINFDYEKFLRVAECDRRIYQLANKYLGLRPPRTVCFHEALVDSIVEQNINLKFAMVVKSRLVKNWGMSLKIKGVEYFAFPKPEQLAFVKQEELKSKVRATLRKAETIISVSKSAMKNSLPTIEDVKRNPEAVINELAKIKGIGTWTAEMAIAKVAEDFKIGPAGDLAVKRGFAKVLGVKDENQIRDIMKGLGNYGGLVLYLMALVPNF